MAANVELLKLESGDKLNIVVSSALTPEAAAQYNLPLQSVRIGATDTNLGVAPQTTTPFYVDTKGDIDFPVLGKIRVAGLTREELAEQIQTALKIVSYSMMLWLQLRYLITLSMCWAK